MRRVRHCHKVCSLFGTVSALQLVSEVGWQKKRTWTPLGTRFLRVSQEILSLGNIVAATIFPKEIVSL